VSDFSNDYVSGNYPHSVDDRTAHEGQRPSFFDFDDPFGTDPMINLKDGWHGFGSLTEIAFTSGGSVIGSGTSIYLTSNVDITGSLTVPTVDVSSLTNVVYYQEGNTYFIGPTNTSVLNTIKSGLTSGVLMASGGTYEVDEAITPQDNITITGTRATVFEMVTNVSVVDGGGSSGDMVANFNLDGFTITQTTGDTDMQVGINMAYCENSFINEIYTHDVNDGFLYLTNCDYVDVKHNLFHDCGMGFPSTEADVVTSLFIGSGCDHTRLIANTGYDNTNLIVRGDCESATAPMVEGETTPHTNNATFARSSDQAYEGTYSYKATKTIAAGTAGAVDLVDNETNTDMHGLIAGLTYKFCMYIYIPSTGGPAYDEVRLQIFDYDGGWISTDTYAVNTTDAWQYVEVERTIAAGATGAIVKIRFDSTAANTEYIYVDNIRLYSVGTNNEHSQQLVDEGTGTQESANSWQGAFPA